MDNPYNLSEAEMEQVKQTLIDQKKLDLPKIKINEASKTFYTSEIKTEKQLTAAYRTFNLLELSSIMAVNYDWGRFDMIDTREKRRKIEEEARERRDNNVTN